MPSIYRPPKWYRRRFIPNWFRHAYRNGQVAAKITFKRFGARKWRPTIRRMVWRPFKRTVLYNEFRFIHRSFRNDFKKSAARTPGGFGPRLKAFVNLYYERVRNGELFFGPRGPFFQQRFTGFTSEESYQAGLPYEQTAAGYPDQAYSMSLEQAKQILDIPPEQYYPRVVDRQFAKIFLNNQISNGGTYYILSRIFCAKKVLDRNIMDLNIRDPPHLRPKVDIWNRAQTAAGRPDDTPTPFNSKFSINPDNGVDPSAFKRGPNNNGFGGPTQGPRYYSTIACYPRVLNNNNYNNKQYKNIKTSRFTTNFTQQTNSFSNHKITSSNLVY